MAIPQSRILDLAKTQCRIFSTIYNPDRLKLGNNILRQRLKGPAIASYYPPRVAPWSTVRKYFKNLGYTMYNEAEHRRLKKLKELRARGKGQWQERRGFTNVKKRK